MFSVLNTDAHLKFTDIQNKKILKDFHLTTSAAYRIKNYLQYIKNTLHVYRFRSLTSASSVSASHGFFSRFLNVNNSEIVRQI